MSIAPVSSSFSAFQPSAVQGNPRQIRQDFQNLASALKSGDLAGAKDAFSALQQLLQGFQPPDAGPSPGSGNKLQNQLGADLAAIGKALQSGDLGSAQDSLKKLLDDMQASHGGQQRQAQVGQVAFNSISILTSASAGGAAGGATAGSVRIDTTA